MKLLLRLLTILTGSIAAAAAAGSFLLDRRVKREAGLLVRDADAASSDPIQLDALPDLPLPVRRYLAFAGVDGRERLRFARLKHGGTFRASADRPWMPVEGHETIAAEPPGFVWKATMRPHPLVPIRGRDAYLHGRGSMLIRPFGFIPLANGRGDDFDQSAFARWVCELFWIPTALVPGEHIGWEPIDDRTAQLRARDGALEVSAVVHFDDEGRLTRVEANRYRAVGKRSILTPFVGRASRYEEVGGLRVPMEVEAAWLLDSGELPYARFVIDRIEFDQPQPG